MSHAPIVVGLDGTPASAEALRWAAWESQETSAPLIAVHVYDAGGDHPHAPDLASVEHALARATATCWFRDALSECSALPWQAHLHVVEGTPSAVLVEMTRDAAMLVLGAPPQDPSHPGLRQALAERYEAAVACPVVLVPAADAHVSSPS